MKIAYLINRYPAVSHSFIRREIAGIESAGIGVSRFSIRPFDQFLPDPADQAEADRTVTILADGVFALSKSTIRVFVRRPGAFCSALKIAFSAFLSNPRRDWRHFAYLLEAGWLSQRLDGINHLHAHFGTNPAAVARLVSRMTGIPYSFTIHGPDEFDAPIALDLHGKTADARYVMTVSSYGRSQLMRWSQPADWGKIKVVPCGVDRVFTESVLGRKHYGSILCCVARLSAQKGIPLLIDAVAELSRRREDFHVQIVGDGEMRRELEEMIAARNLNDRVSITGFVGSAEVRAALLSARALVLPSFAEGLPVVIMEAFALGIPAIVTAIAGIPELVDDTCGWVVPAGSSSALVTAMESALDCDDNVLREKGRNGRARVLAGHDSVKIGASLAAMFASTSC